MTLRMAVQPNPLLIGRSDMSRPRILLADDHPMVLEGIAKLVENFGTVVGKVEDGRTLLEKARQVKPEMVIMDISMPNLNGVEAARQLKTMLPQCRIIFLTMHADPSYVAAAFEAGGEGFLLKRSATAELQSAVEAVWGGRVYVTPLVQSEQDITSHSSRRRDLFPVPKLTSRQREVLQLIGEGHSTKQIATLLHISPKTVEFHKARLMETVGMHTVADLTRYAVSHGLLDI